MGFSFYENSGGAQDILKPKRMNDSVVEVFGRHNPPHMGHAETFKMANEIAGNENADPSPMITKPRIVQLNELLKPTSNKPRAIIIHAANRELRVPY